MRWNIPPSLSLFPLIFPSAVSPPPLPLSGYMSWSNDFGVYHCSSGDRQKRTAPLLIRRERLAAAAASVCTFRRPHTVCNNHIRKIAACPLRCYRCGVEDILSLRLDGVTACAFLFDKCAIRAPAVKLLASGIHLNTRGLPVGSFYLHSSTRTRPPSQFVWLLIGSRVLLPFVSGCMWTCPCGVRQRSLSPRTMIHAV